MSEMLTIITNLIFAVSAFGFVVFLFLMRKPFKAALITLADVGEDTKVKRLLTLLRWGRAVRRLPPQ
jgi:hypothetical protein